MTSDKNILSLDQPGIYEIVVVGRLDQNWSENFGGMTISVEYNEDGQAFTCLIGTVPDQAGLHGLLRHIRDLALPLIKVRYIPSEEADQKEI